MTKYASELPVQPFPVRFQISTGGVANAAAHVISTQYRETPEGGWLMDIFDFSDEPLVMGIPLVSGLDLLWQFNHLALGFSLVVLCLNGRTTPTYESLGVEDKVVLIEEF